MRAIWLQKAGWARKSIFRASPGPGLQTQAAQYAADPLALALQGGEDYELLFSAAPEMRSTIEQLQKDCSCPISRVGKLSALIEGIVLRDEHGNVHPAQAAGYDHFRHSVKGG